MNANAVWMRAERQNVGMGNKIREKKKRSCYNSMRGSHLWVGCQRRRFETKLAHDG